MDHDSAPAYGLWSLVVINSLVFIIFAFSFTKPKTARDWRSFGPFHVASNILIFGGFWLLAVAWDVLYRAHRTGRLATTRIYARMRHPQYVAFVLIMFGFLLQWPAILTLAMFPILVVMYGYLATREEADMAVQFGKEYEMYAARTPRFIPKLGAIAAVS
jgi:protein-S-isoprenylcysteine O-methyltransferase Ste14